MRSDWGIDNEHACGGTPDDDFTEADRLRLIRQWWYEYAVLLRDRRNAAGGHDRLNAVTASCEHFGIVRPGVPMTRKGAEDLVRECDLIIKKSLEVIHMYRRSKPTSGRFSSARYTWVVDTCLDSPDYVWTLMCDGQALADGYEATRREAERKVKRAYEEHLERDCEE